jgi:hypothetical protein
LETVGRPAKRSYDAETAIRAGDIHSDMGLQNRLPAVLAELDAEKFQKLCGLQFIRREGTTSAPKQFLAFTQLAIRRRECRNLEHKLLKGY